MIVDRDGVGEAVLLTPVQHIRGEWEQLAELATTPTAVLPISFPFHPAVVLAIADDVDLLDIVHTDVGSEHGSVRVPREPVGVSEAVGVDFAKRVRVAV